MNGRGHYGTRVGATDPQLRAASLAVLRSLRGKLGAIVDRNAGVGPDQIFLVVDARPPVGISASLGGDSQYLTPENLTAANAALLLGGELPILLTVSEPGEYRSSTEVGFSREHVGQLLARVTRALGRVDDALRREGRV